MLSLQATALKGKFRLQHKDFLHFVDNFPFFNYVSCYVHGSSLGLLLDTALTMLVSKGRVISYLCLQMVLGTN